MKPFTKKAYAAWRGDPPDWIIVLAAACDRSTQTAVSADLGLNQAYVSYAIRNDKSDYHRKVEDAVRSRLMGATLDCPVVGEMALDRCRILRRSKIRPLGPVSKQLRIQCPVCPHNIDSKEASDGE